MAAATGNLRTKRLTRGLRSVPAAASVTCFQGALVSVDASGYARPARTSTTDKCIGVCRAKVANGAVAAAVNVEVDGEGVYGPFANSASGDLIARANIGSVCYVVDDQTVALTSGSSTRIVAGTVFDVDAAGGVYLRF